MIPGISKLYSPTKPKRIPVMMIQYLHSKKYQNGKVFSKSDVILMRLGVLTSKHLQILDALMRFNYSYWF